MEWIWRLNVFVDCSFIAQAEHLAEVHLRGSVLDLAEREQGYIATLDLDLDTIAAAIGFTKQTLATIGADSGMWLERCVNLVG